MIPGERVHPRNLTTNQWPYSKRGFPAFQGPSFRVIHVTKAVGPCSFRASWGHPQFRGSGFEWLEWRKWTNSMGFYHIFEDVPKKSRTRSFLRKAMILRCIFFGGDMEMNQIFGVFFLFCSYPWDDLTWFFWVYFHPIFRSPLCDRHRWSLRARCPNLRSWVVFWAASFCVVIWPEVRHLQANIREVFQGSFGDFLIFAAPQKNSRICQYADQLS